MAIAKIDTADQLEHALEVYEYLKFARDHELAQTPDSIVKAMESLERWIEALEDALDNEEADEVEAEIKVNGTVPWDQVKAELGL